MTSKTKTTKTKKTTKQVATRTSSAATITLPLDVVTEQITDNDFKTALLVVSLAVNAFIFIAWVVLKVTSVYDYQIATFLFYR